MVRAVRSRHHRAIVLAESQQRFFIAQAFQQGQTQCFARALILPGRVLYTTIGEGLWLVIVVRCDKRQGIGEQVLAAVEAGAQGIQISHAFFL